MSTLKTNTIQAATGSTVNVASGHVLNAPGHVLQVKYFQLTEPQIETYGTTNTDKAVTNFNINITPTSTSSIIKLEANLMFESGNAPWDTMWFFYRDTTKLGATGSIGSRRSGIITSVSSHSRPDNVNNDSTPELASVTYFDAPSSTSQINYKLGLNTSGTAAFYINRTVNNADTIGFERGVSFMSVTEIAQ